MDPHAAVEDLDWSQYPAAWMAHEDLASVDFAVGEFDGQDTHALLQCRSSELAAFAAAIDHDINDLSGISKPLRRMEVIDWLLAGERPVRPLGLRAVLQLRVGALRRDRAAGRVDPAEGNSRQRELTEALQEVVAVGERLSHFSLEPLTPSPRRTNVNAAATIPSWQRGPLLRLASRLASSSAEELTALGIVADELRALPESHKAARDFARQSEPNGRWQTDANRIHDAIGLARGGVDIALPGRQLASSESSRHAIYWAAMDLATALTLKAELALTDFEAQWQPYEEAVPDLFWLRSTAFFPANRPDMDELLARPDIAAVVQVDGSQPYARWDVACPTCMSGFVPFGWEASQAGSVQFCFRCPTIALADAESIGQGRVIRFFQIVPRVDERRAPESGAYSSAMRPRGWQSSIGARVDEPDGALVTNPRMSEPNDGGAADAAFSVNGWVPTEAMLEARHFHTATLLTNESVLVVGGAGGSGGEPEPLRSAELYDPHTESWTATSNMSAPRTAHTTTPLHDGTVLVAGGNSDTSDLASAEVYDPSSGIWAVTGTMLTARAVHTATLLPDGKVLVAGGADSMRPSASMASAELYDPASRSWVATASMGTPRQRHTATLLADGSVLVAGGANSRGALASAEVYDPRTGSWSAVKDMVDIRVVHTATLLPDGRVLVVGGSTGRGGALASAELYDPDSQSWSASGSMNGVHSGHTATLLPNGRVVIAGGASHPSRPLETVELYDPTLAVWTAADRLISARAVHTATLLPDGKTLVAGGGNVDALASAELHNLDFLPLESSS